MLLETPSSHEGASIGVKVGGNDDVAEDCWGCACVHVVTRPLLSKVRDAGSIGAVRPREGWTRAHTAASRQVALIGLGSPHYRSVFFAWRWAMGNHHCVGVHVQTVQTFGFLVQK
jgi:hypothetical protein